tara:strand:+ start:529 stop:834 length:306 start_codon:yes stop_codon:yes gene_type:complete
MIPLLLCNSDEACDILGSVLFSVFLFWPAYSGWAIAGFISKYVKLMFLGALSALLTAIWMYDSTINLGRDDLYWIPAIHLVFAVLMLLIAFVNNYKLKSEQ